MMIARLITSKTAWTAIVGVVTALGAAMTGEIEWGEAIKLMFMGLLALFARDAIAGRGPGKYPAR